MNFKLGTFRGDGYLEWRRPGARAAATRGVLRLRLEPELGLEPGGSGGVLGFASLLQGEAVARGRLGSARQNPGTEKRQGDPDPRQKGAITSWQRPLVYPRS